MSSSVERAASPLASCGASRGPRASTLHSYKTTSTCRDALTVCAFIQSDDEEKGMSQKYARNDGSTTLLTERPRHKVLLMGASGSGKTSMRSLILFASRHLHVLQLVLLTLFPAPIIPLP